MISRCVFRKLMLSLMIMFNGDSPLTAAGKSVGAINTKLQTCFQEVSDWCSADMMLL